MRICMIRIITIISLVLIWGCAEENKKTQEKEILKIEKSISTICPPYISENKRNNLNISILLDLSDRIEMGNQMHKDTAYLASLSRAFISHVKKKKVLFLEDRLQLFFNPEPLNNEINEIAERLSIVFTKNTNKQRIIETQTLYDELPSKLYDLAKADAKLNKGYLGSDIWRFFEHDVKDYCIDDCHRNILVILTDGYMYHEKTFMKNSNRTSFLTPKHLAKLKLKTANWKNEISRKDLGFIPATTDLNDLEVLVIGIDKQSSNSYAQDVIEAYWYKWFLEMGVLEQNIKIKNADISRNIEKVINDFIFNKK